MMKARYWCTGIGLVILAWLFLISPRRDAEFALGLKWLPWSARNVLVSVDAWTDYGVKGYIELSPTDCERMLSLRQYEREDHPGRPIDIPELLDGSRRFSTTTFRWSDGTAQATLEVDSSRSWIHFSYATD